MHKRGGRPCANSPFEDKLVSTLKHLREYRAMEHIAYDYGRWEVSKSIFCELIQWVENALVKDGTFKLHGKKVLKEIPNKLEYVVIDVTEKPYSKVKKTKSLLFRPKEAPYDKNSE